MAGINDDMDLSQHGLDCIKIFEEDSLNPVLEAYDDGTGTPTIGWGCTTGVTMGMRITAEQAEQMFRDEMAEFIDTVRKRIKVRLTQDQFDALVSFFFNEGSAAGASVVRAVNAKQFDRVPSCLMLYVKARKSKGAPLTTWPGLVKRRQQEIALWSGTFSDARLPRTLDKPMAQRAQAEEPARSAGKIVAQSPTLLSLIMAFCISVLDGVKWAIGHVSQFLQSMPDAVSDAKTSVSSFTSVLEMLNVNAGKISVGMTAALLLLAFVRHVDLHMDKGD